MNSRPVDLESDFYIAHGEILFKSFNRLTGQKLLDKEDRANDIIEIYNAPFAVVSHGVETDPVFNFGNRVALNLFEMGWNDFIKLPSRQSAEPIQQKERDKLLNEVSQNGFIKNYRGVRISASGTKFLIEHATVWNLLDSKGINYGQAAMFKDWTVL